MNNTQHMMNNLWLWKCGLPEEDYNSKPIDIASLRITEWSTKFEELMRNRLVMGAIRYGKLHEHGKPQYDRVGSMIKRLSKYEYTGNKEHLIDVANLCLLEFEECYHPNANFNSIDDGEHTKAIN